MKKTMIAVLALVAGLIILNLAYHPGPEPDLILPMCNQHIEWHYAGK